MMKKVWSANHNELYNFLFDRYHGKNFFWPILVLSNSKYFLNTKYAPKDIKNDIIRADQLINYIKKDIDSMDDAELCGEKTLKQVAEIWLSRTIPNNTSLANKCLSKIKNKEELENKLIKFRKEKSKAMNVPAYYIFTDEELNKL